MQEFFLFYSNVVLFYAKLYYIVDQHLVSIFLYCYKICPSYRKGHFREKIGRIPEQVLQNRGPPAISEALRWFPGLLQAVLYVVKLYFG